MLQSSAAALQKVREYKTCEAKDGHNGTWVAHPGLVSIAREEFDIAMPTSNQIHRRRENVTVTAEISRTKVWQWVHHPAAVMSKA